MIHRATQSNSWYSRSPRSWRSRRARAAPADRIPGSAHLAWLVVLAHLFVAAHTVAHAYRAPIDPASSHCAICQLGKHSAEAAAMAVVVSPFTATWIARFANPPAPVTRSPEGACLARAPPAVPPRFAIS